VSAPTNSPSASPWARQPAASATHDSIRPSASAPHPAPVPAASPAPAGNSGSAAPSITPARHTAKRASESSRGGAARDSRSRSLRRFSARPYGGVPRITRSRAGRVGGGGGGGKNKGKGKGKGKRLCEFRVLGPELGEGAEGAREALAHAGREVRVERPANDEVHEVGEVRAEEGRVRGAEGREKVDCRGYLLVVLAALEQRGEARGEARKEGRQRVGGAEVEHLRDDAEDAREAEGVVRLGREGREGQKAHREDVCEESDESKVRGEGRGMSSHYGVWHGADRVPLHGRLEEVEQRRRVAPAPERINEAGAGAGRGTGHTAHGEGSARARTLQGIWGGFTPERLRFWPAERPPWP
jgi:hypothetical protein